MEKAQKFVTEIDPDEVGCRFFEAMRGISRPAGMTATQALECLHEEDRKAVRRGEVAVLTYWQQCIAKMQQVS